MEITAIIYEDNSVLRQSIANMLALHEEFAVLGQFEFPGDIIEQVSTLKPDIILMDIDMPGMTGIAGVRALRKTNPEIPILMLTVFDDNDNVFQALRAGATGYLLKKHIPTKLFEAMHEALGGGAPMSPSVARMVISSMHKVGHTPENTYQLTPREKEILQSLSKGNSYKLIAAEYHLGIDTVRGHIKKIYEKLRVHSQIEAVSKAISEKLV